MSSSKKVVFAGSEKKSGAIERRKFFKSLVEVERVTERTEPDVLDPESSKLGRSKVRVLVDADSRESVTACPSNGFGRASRRADSFLLIAWNPGRRSMT